MVKARLPAREFSFLSLGFLLIGLVMFGF